MLLREVAPWLASKEHLLCHLVEAGNPLGDFLILPEGISVHHARDRGWPLPPEWTIRILTLSSRMNPSDFPGREDQLDASEVSPKANARAPVAAPTPSERRKSLRELSPISLQLLLNNPCSRVPN
jgi:hypothetical protein